MIAGRPSETGGAGSALLGDGGEVRQVGDLEAKGIAQVRLISQSQFKSAVREAVATEVLAIIDGLELSPRDREKVEERALARLGGDPFALPPRRETASAAAPTLDPPVEEKPAPATLPSLETTAAPEAAAASPPNPTPAPAPPAQEIDVEAMESRIVEEVGRLVSQNWRDELQTAQSSQRNQIDRLEGRIDSLMKALDQIERLIDQQQLQAPAAAPSSFIDSGALGGIKNELLEQLFEANLALRELEAGDES